MVVFCVLALAVALAATGRIAAAESERLRAVLTAQRIHIEEITSLRRDVRKTHVALLESWISPSAQRWPSSAPVESMLEAVRQRRDDVREVGLTEPAEGPIRDRLLAAVEAWEAAMSLTWVGSRPERLRSLHEAVAHVDTAAEAMVALNANSGTAVDAQFDELYERQSRAEKGFLIILFAAGCIALFSRARVVANRRLAAQTAVSVEKTRLLEREHAGRLEAEAERRRAVLLGEATALLSSTLDYTGVFDALTQLCTRSFADWAVIDLLDAGRIIRLSGAHRDPTKKPLLGELSERYPALRGTRAPAAITLEHGIPILLPALTDEQVRAHSIDEHHAELIDKLGSRSAIAVPLVARDTRLGALTLAAAAPHQFGRADLEMAEELGRRAALAIDNARLLHDKQQALDAREEFLAIASHELRTPITSLRLTLDGLLQSTGEGQAVSTEVLDRSLNRILRKTERLQQITVDLLDVTGIEHGRLDIRPAKVELSGIVREVVEQFARELESARCTVSIECDTPVFGMWDASRLDQVVTNLLSNAIKFGAGRPIEIRIGEADGVANLMVKDQGIGIDPSRLPYVFDRFERAVPSAQYGGFGLGLYIAQWIVRVHDGNIRVESKLGEGSTFIVELPCLNSGSASSTPPGRNNDLQQMTEHIQ